jgi:putative tryptophan/tyrosine transport system substrate-binding protein
MTGRDIIAAAGVITVIGLAAVLAMVSWPWGARAPREDLQLIGFIDIQSAGASVPYVTAFRDGLKETGYIEGRQIRIAYRWADGDDQKVTWMASELAARRVAVIAVSRGLRSARAVQKATSTIPALFVTGANPVEAGLVASLNRPGRNLTGVRLDNAAMVAKRLELLKELMPSGGKVAVLIGPGSVAGDRRFANVQSEQRVAENLGAAILRIHGPEDFDRDLDDMLAAAVRGGVRGLIVGADPFLASRCGALAALAAQHGLVATYALRSCVEAGGLASYGPDLIDVYRQVGMYAGQILKGASPGDLPVVSPRKWELVINRQTAASLRLAIPPWLVARANEIID